MKRIPMRTGSRVMAAVTIVALVLVNSSAQKRGPQLEPREVVVPNLGLKLIPLEGIQPGGRTVTISQVSAVQEGSTAYLAGVQPGDLILGTWKRGNLSPQEFLNHVTRDYQMDSDIALDINFLVDTSGRKGSYAVTVYFENPGQGRWTSTKVLPSSTDFRRREPLPGLLQARETAKQLYQAHYDQILADIDANPCARNTNALESPLKALAGKAGIQAPAPLWKRAQSGCENKTQGALPEFEATVMAMLLDLIDPCSYTVSSDHSKALTQARTLKSKKIYDEMALNWMGFPSEAPGRGQGGNDSDAADAKRKCFLNFLQASLTGTTVKSR